MLQYLFFLNFLYITKINNTEKYIRICFNTVSIFKTKETTIHHHQNVKSNNAKPRKTQSPFSFSIFPLTVSTADIQILILFAERLIAFYFCRYFLLNFAFRTSNSTCRDIHIVHEKGCIIQVTITNDLNCQNNHCFLKGRFQIKKYKIEFLVLQKFFHISTF